MAIRFELEPGEEEALAFACSPLLETVLSLHVLAEPRHHALQHEWVRAARRLPSSLRREIAVLSFLYRWTIPNCVLPTASGSDEDFETEVAALRRLSSTSPRSSSSARFTTTAASSVTGGAFSPTLRSARPR